MSELPTITPKLDGNGVGFCDDACPQYDGKRCELTGFRPSGVCEPWAQRLVAESVRLKEQLVAEMRWNNAGGIEALRAAERAQAGSHRFLLEAQATLAEARRVAALVGARLEGKPA